MSIWGKIFGGTSGFVVGGPLGGLLGIFAGHAIDKFNSKKLPENIAIKQVNFTIGVIALSAKMAKADGIVSSKELDAFKKGLIINQNELRNVEKVWNFAKQSVHGFESYAKQLAKLFKPSSFILENLVHLLFSIAKSDGQITIKETNFLKKVSDIFGFDDKKFNLFIEIYTNDQNDPYTILQSNIDDPIDLINQRRIFLLKKHHPDVLISKGQPFEFVEKNNHYVKMINKSWEFVKKNHYK
ncbi:TerB family tellurite resistance protein [Alphaproteobacteria bacterium]|nr:TerB family tellurite resistance protein [Alphaproteobacteria bacterium]